MVSLESPIPRTEYDSFHRWKYCVLTEDKDTSRFESYRYFNWFSLSIQLKFKITISGKITYTGHNTLHYDCSISVVIHNISSSMFTTFFDILRKYENIKIKLSMSYRFYKFRSVSTKSFNLWFFYLILSIHFLSSKYYSVTQLHVTITRFNAFDSENQKIRYKYYICLQS